MLRVHLQVIMQILPEGDDQNQLETLPVVTAGFPYPLQLG